MTKKGKLKLFFLIYSALTIILCGCVSFVEKTGLFLDGSYFAEETISLFRAYPAYGAPAGIDLEIVENKDGDKSVIIIINDYPMMKLRCEYPQEDGTFYFTSLEYLAGYAHGWNEFSVDLYGKGLLYLREVVTLEITDEPVQLQLTKGRIHRYDTRITGDEALTALQNRRERISALAAWMLSNNTAENMSIKEFESYWKKIIFPEIFSKKKRPERWMQEGDQFQFSEDINWNISYTDRIFPQELRTVRNSGTLLRDWEEALSFIYLEYEWENIIKLLSQRIFFYKIK